MNTVDPADGDAFDDSNDENAEPGAVVVHQLQHVHSSLHRHTQLNVVVHEIWKIDIMDNRKVD